MHSSVDCLLGSNNASDGISIINVAEGAMTEVHEMLQRLNELSVKAANGYMSDGDRGRFRKKWMHFWKRSTGSLSPTEFNGRRLIDGTYDLKGFVEKSVNETDATFDTLSVKVESYSDEAKIGIYEIKLETSMKTEMRREIDEDGMAVDVPYTYP